MLRPKLGRSISRRPKLRQEVKLGLSILLRPKFLLSDLLSLSKTWPHSMSAAVPCWRSCHWWYSWARWSAVSQEFSPELWCRFTAFGRCLPFHPRDMCKMSWLDVQESESGLSYAVVISITDKVVPSNIEDLPTVSEHQFPLLTVQHSDL